MASGVDGARTMAASTDFMNEGNVSDEGEIVDSTPVSPDEKQQNANTDDMDLEYDSPDVSNHDQKLTPAISITFHKKDFENAYRDKILSFLTSELEPCTIVPNCENSSEYEIYKEDVGIEKSGEVLGFELDVSPDDNVNNSRVPYYGRTSDVMLSDKIESPQPKKNPSASACFNCLGDHNMRDCTKPRDQNAINRNRTKFQQNSKPVKTSRYHLDENQKFSHIVPGKISKKLRKALGLKSDEQPEFIYRMRELGYPPAWLEEAKVSHSGVVIYHNKGVPVLEDNEEEGEIIPDGAKDKYDITKIIDFPGFNVPLPKDMKDDTKYYRCPPMKEEQSKEHMIRDLQPVEAYRKRSLKPTAEEQSSERDSSTPPSPSIEEMEEKKRRLLMALDDDGGSDSKLSQEDNSTSNQEGESEPKESCDSVPATPVKEVGQIKKLDYGTPVLKSVSSFSKLPSREQFSTNIADVIYFDNLPDSTGKYETMTHIITKIRKSQSGKTQNDSK